MTFEIATFFLVGALAQIVDGALGMAFGVISTSLLLSLGVAPAVTSATVHVCKIATGAASGVSHLALGNVDRRLFLLLALPGALGGMIGAYVLVSLPAEIARPLVAAYLFAMGVLIVRRVLRSKPDSVAATPPGAVGLLGLVGGFLDATGGGGWGPIVTSGLLVKGVRPPIAIGSANLAEFLVAVCASGVFLVFAGLYWQAILGLALGGVVMAPVAALLVKRLPARLVLAAVALLVFALSARIAVTTFTQLGQNAAAPSAARSDSAMAWSPPGINLDAIGAVRRTPTDDSDHARP